MEWSRKHSAHSSVVCSGHYIGQWKHGPNMSLFNWIWDFDQDSKITTSQEKIEALEKRVDILEQWIRYLTEKEDLNDNEEREPVQ